METMADCVDSVLEGAREEVSTPCWWFIGVKGSRVEEAEVTG